MGIKRLLSIIAFLLFIMVIQNVFEIKAASAAGGVARVAICNVNGSKCLPIYTSGDGEVVGIKVFGG
jgi:hypothetical protein